LACGKVFYEETVNAPKRESPVTENQTQEKHFTSVEARIDVAARRILELLPRHGVWGSAVEFLVFGLKQAWACLFGGSLLALMLLSSFIWPADAAIARYDALFIAAVLIQIAMLVFRLERPSEAIVILVFHIVGTGMEVFKTGAGSWSYPEHSIFHIGAVPLFSGFMYASVGSYIARITRIFDIRYSAYPSLLWTSLLAICIYINFFSHHFIWDMRWLLFVFTAMLYWRTFVHYRVFRFRHSMPLLVGFFLVALFIWLGENLATWAKVWVYPNQKSAWTFVSLGKFGSWYLLMIISFVLVNLVHRPKHLEQEKLQTAASPQ
jgi:uncharacterized membrane protein YoaT (DUF817 family)